MKTVKNEDDHEQLPYHHHICFDTALFYVIDLNRYQLKDLDETDSELEKFDYQTSYSFLENIDIFQPPQYL